MRRCVTGVQWIGMWCNRVWSVPEYVPCEEPVLQVVRISTVLAWNVDCQCARDKGGGDWGPRVHPVATLLVSSEDIHSLHWWQHSSVTVIILRISMWRQHDSHAVDIAVMCSNISKTDMRISHNVTCSMWHLMVVVIHTGARMSTHLP